MNTYSFNKTLVKSVASLAIVLLSPITVASEPPVLSTQSQDNYFKVIKSHCGKAYSGKVTIDNAQSDSFANKKLVMHVRECSENQIKIPFHVGADSSRTWILTRTGSGISLKHDHRHKDGSHDELTMYGGHTEDAGWSQVQSFPADAPTQEMFTRLGLPQSNTNIWQMYIYPEQFTYRLIREGREFRVDFDLTKEIKAPKAPWGYD